MSWNLKRRRPYYYRWDSVRSRNVYVGRGQAAEQAAQDVADRRQARIAARQALARDQTRTAGAEQALYDFTDNVLILLRATLTAAGYYQHRRQWRPRHGRHRNPDAAR